jgi:hypothetical protein
MSARPCQGTPPADGFDRAVGVGLKPRHYRDILDGRPAADWFEVHAENYMGAGGPPHAYLAAIAERWPLSIHGVGASIGGAGRLDPEHLARLKRLVARYRPALFSEHLAWSTHAGVFLNDLLPLPYDRAALRRVVEHIDEMQSTLGRRLLLENPSTYLEFAASTYDELGFLAEVVRRSGCGLLLDVNNAYVSAVNHGRDAAAYLSAFPMAEVGEIHLAGHAREADDDGEPLLIDAHDRPVDAVVWRLFRDVVARSGPRPTLIEWDRPVPDWATLEREAVRARRHLARALRETAEVACVA